MGDRHSHGRFESAHERVRYRRHQPSVGHSGVVRFAGVNGYTEHPYRFDGNSFGPRFGFAWKAPGASKVVIRGGHGIFFAHPLDSVQAVAASLGFSVSILLSGPDGNTAPFRL